MAKPATRPDGWAATGPLTTPTSGKRAAGFVPGERGAAQYFNWNLFWIGEWLKWLDLGILDGNYEITGNLIVDGTFTHADTVSWFVNPDCSFEGNNFTAAAAIHAPNRAGWTFAGNVTPIYYAIIGLRDGDTILGYTMTLRKASGVGNTVATKFVTTTNAGDAVTAGDSNAGAAGTYALGAGDTVNIAALSSAAYYIKIIPAAAGAGDAIDSVTVSVKRTKG